MSYIWLIASSLFLHTFVDDPPKPVQVVMPKDDGIEAIAINTRGDIVYFEWIESKKQPGVVEQLPFYLKGKESIAIPLLEGYTMTAPTAVSDSGMVVGRVSKPRSKIGPSKLANQAFVWDEKTGIRGLGTLEGDASSVACDITPDARTISGYSQKQGELKPCIWERDGENWKASALPHEHQLGSQVVAISDNGRYVTAVDGTMPCLWSRGEDGNWTRKEIGNAGTMIPRAVNNAGTVVGLQHTGDGLTHAVVWNPGLGMARIEKPAGYVKSSANAINNDGVIVGMIDGPAGSEIGPNGFVWEKGHTRIIKEGGDNFVLASAINDARQVTGTLEKKEKAQENNEEKPEKP